MPKTEFILWMCLALSACGDAIQTIDTTHSPNGDVQVDYVRVLYGGAAGGITYCVNLKYGDKLDKCAIAAIHVDGARLVWSGRNVIYEYCDGTVTNNESGTKQATGVIPFQLSIRQSCEP